MRLISFYEWDLWHRRDASGYNKVGFVTRNDQVIRPLRAGLADAPLDRFRGATVYSLPLTDFDGLKVDEFFTQNRRHVGLFNRGIKALLDQNASFFYHPIKLPILGPVVTSDYEERWTKFVSDLKPGDLIFSLDTKSSMSRFIAALDHGTWSHVALYLGTGCVCEAIPGGVSERDITYYKSARYRLGAYRSAATDQQVEQLIAFNRAQLGKPYNYLGAIRLGVIKVLAPEKAARSPSTTSPNDLAALSGLTLTAVL